MFRAKTWPAVLLFLLIATPISFLGLGAIDVITMEGIVADGARHMARTHEYAVPYLHGEIYSYKPPLAYWLALASFRLFGEETEWSLRFPFALSGLLMGLGVLLLTRRVAGSQAALLCALASMTGVLTIQKLHLAEWDMALTAGVGIAAAVACRNFAAQPRGGLWLVGYLALALAFLVKGAPALMFYAPGLLLAAWLTGRFKELFRVAHLAGVALFTLLAACWIASAYQAVGWAAFEQPLAEARDKGLTWNLSYLGSTLAKPLLAVVFFLPWTLLLPASFRSGAWRSEPIRRMALAAAAFAAAGVAVFMTVPADDSRYLLPVAVPMAMLCGLAARDVLPAAGGHRRRAIEVLALVVGLGALATAFGAEDASIASRWWLALCAAVTLAAVARGFLRSASPAVGLLAAVAILGWLAQTWIVGPHRASSRSLRGMAASFEAHMSAESGSPRRGASETPPRRGASETPPRRGASETPPRGGADATLWTAPVSKDYRHSSLFFYLRRPISTLSAEGSGPQAGDYVVLFSDEHPELIAAAASAYQVVERRQQRGYEYVLARVREHERAAGRRPAHPDVDRR